MNQLTEYLNDWLGISPAMLGKILATLFVLFLLILIRKFVLGMIYRYNENMRQNYSWRNVITYSLFFIGLLIIGRIWFEGMSSMITYLGLLSAGIAIALQSPILNLAGWVFLLLNRPFKVGDRIQIGDFAGDVIDIRPFEFTLNEIGNWVDADQSTGRFIKVPNGKIFSEPMANYNKGFGYIWNEIPVLLTFESDWKKAKKILTEIVESEAEDIQSEARNSLKQANKDYLIVYSKLTPIVYTDVKDSGILLTLRFLTSPWRRRGSQAKIWEAILDAFGEEKYIDFAYPSIRYYDNRSEGKKPFPPPPST